MSSIVKNGVDYSSGSISAEDLKSAGHEFACRYLSQDGRALTSAEVDDFKTNGIGIVTIAEYDKIDDGGNQISAMLGGGAKGHAHAAYAEDRRKELKLPDQQVIYFTLDVEPGSIPWSLVSAYLEAAAETLGGKSRTGLYAGYGGIEFVVENDLVDWPWQTYSWSRGQLHPKALLYQYDIFGEFVAGVDVDLNKAFAENYGQAQFETTPPVNPWIVPLHPDWFVESLSIRYPTVGHWEWEKQNLSLHTVRHNALTRSRVWQYAAPTTTSGHAGPQLNPKTKVNVERMTEVEDAYGRERSWVLTGNGTWIPEDALDLDFSITRRKPRRV